MGELMQTLQPLYQLEVLTGPDKGSMFQINSPNITIGRDESCDITINKDPKCSRQHASITLQGNSFLLKNISEKNKVLLNDHEIQEEYILPNTIFILGKTEIRFLAPDTNDLALVDSPQEVQNHIAESRQQTPQNYNPHIGNFNSNSTKNLKKDNGKRNFYIILGIILIGLVWLLNSGSSKKKNKISIADKKQIEQEIDRNSKLLKKENELRKQLGKNRIEYKRAQVHYVRGFRDYKKGQYERAIVSFQTCLSLFPKHFVCSRYLSLSRKKQSELIQYHMFLGRGYLKQNQFQACKASFQNVMHMIKDPTNPRYKEAYTNYKLCNSKLQDRF